MRNLKKILALVLAMVMSLSLMATASAAESTAAANDYTIASKVLQGLGVVRGDDGGIREADPITRAEVAALAYRIHTADVTDSKANLYYDLQDAAFDDLGSVEWAKGYIGYAHNAEIVKGVGGKKFNPTSNITGYEVLAMALRAIGYGKNHEFEGAQWQINTAAWGRREGLLEGISALDQTRLDQPATRGMVFQILLNAVLHNDVQFSYVQPDLYVEADRSMADGLHLEVDTGVVIANEWAALDASSPLPANKVKVEVSDGTTRTLNWSADTKETGGDYATGLKDIGKSRTIYMQDSKVLYLADTGKNKVADNNGAGMSLKDAAAKESLSYADAKHYTNFDETTRYYSDWRIEVRLRIAPAKFGDGTSSTTFNIPRATVNKVLGAPEETGGILFYEKVFPVDERLNDVLPIIQEIFRVADDANNTLNIKGEVYVGTKSVDNDKNDVSDTMSYKMFKETYIEEEKTTISSVKNGNWLQVVDNNGDGAAEYVLLVNYDLDTIVETKNSKFYYKGLDIDACTPVEIDGYTQTVGDVVLYAKIDGKAYVHKADTATATFKTVNYKEEYAIDTDDKKWEQSGITNHTALPDELVKVDELTSYSLYLDDYNYVRAYDNKVSYALLTEMYPTQRQNSAWVVDRGLTAEAMLAGDTAVREYNVLNNYYNGTVNPFYTPDCWFYPGITSDWRNDNDTIRYENPNYLQPATHMLDIANHEGNGPFWFGNRDRYVDQATGESEYNVSSWTNVARYTQTSDGLNLYTAASLNGGKAATDYIRLNNSITDWRNINKTAPLFEIDDEYYNETYTSAQNHYVRTVDSTVFFLVTVNDKGTQGIRQYTGYSSLPTITDENNVRSMYAVARNTSANTDGYDYWVADVVVIEMYDYDAYESIALIYSNDYKIQGDVKYVQALDSEKGPIGIIPNNVNVWNNQFADYGFYGLNNITVYDAENNIYRADITRITSNTLSSDLSGSYWNNSNEYNKHGIYYGQVRSIYAEDTYSNYLTIDVLDHNDLVIDTVDVRVASYGGAYAITDKDTYNSLTNLLLKADTVNNKVLEGDKIVWVENDETARTAGFLVDLTDTDADVWGAISKRSWNPTPSFLDVTEAGRIGRAQYTGSSYVGNPNAPWNYEEIIGKRNDNIGTLSRADAPQDGFVVNSYELSANGVSQAPTFSGVMSDGLWHIRYNLDENTVYTVSVDRVTAANLVLNSTTRAVTAFSGKNVGTAESWSFALPARAAGVKVLGTIFAVNTTIPANALYPVSMVRVENDDITIGDPVITLPDDTAALAAIEAAYAQAKEKANGDAEKLAAIEDAYNAAKAAVEAAVRAEGADTASVTAVGEAEAAKILAAAGDGELPPEEITEVTINARLFGTTQTDVETGEKVYFTFKPITVSAENGVFTLTQTDLDALEPNGFTATLTKVVAGGGYTVETVDGGWKITAQKTAITMEVDFESSSLNGDATGGGDDGNTGDEVDKDHVDGSGSGGADITIKPVSRQTLSNVVVGGTYEITVTPREDSVITALQFLKCEEISREKVGESWVCVVTVLSEDWMIKYVAELKDAGKEIVVKFVKDNGSAMSNWADYVNVKVNGEDYTSETKLIAGERSYSITAEKKSGIDPDASVTVTINGEEGELLIRKNTEIREVVIAVTVESLADLKAEAKADIDEAAKAALAKATTAEQEANIKAAQTMRKDVIDKATDKAVIEEQVASFNKQIETILGSVTPVGSSKVDATDPDNRTIEGTYYLEPGSDPLDLEGIMAIVNNNDLGMTFKAKNGQDAGDATTGLTVFDGDMNEYTATIKRVYKVTIDGKEAGYVEETTDSGSNNKLPGVPAGIYFDAENTEEIYAASDSTGTSGKSYKSSDADGLTLKTGGSSRDVALVTGIKVEFTKNTGMDNPFGSDNANVTCGTNQKIAANSYVRPGTMITVTSLTVGGKQDNGEYYYELSVNDGVVASKTVKSSTAALMDSDYKFYADGSANPVKIELAGGVVVNGKYFLKNPATPTAVDVDLADGTYVVVNTTSGSEVASGIVDGTTAANTTVFTVKSGKMTYTTKCVTTTNHVDDKGALTIVPAAEISVPAKSNFGNATAKLTGFGATIDPLALGNDSEAKSIYVPQNATLTITGAMDAVGVKTAAGTVRNDGVKSGANKDFTISVGDADKYELVKMTAIKVGDTAKKIDVVASGNPILTLTKGALAIADTDGSRGTSIKSVVASGWKLDLSGMALTDLESINERSKAGDEVEVTLTFTAEENCFFEPGTEIATGTGVKNIGTPTISEDSSTLTVTITVTVQEAASSGN